MASDPSRYCCRVRTASTCKCSAPRAPTRGNVPLLSIQKHTVLKLDATVTEFGAFVHCRTEGADIARSHEESVFILSVLLLVIHTCSVFYFPW